MVDHRLSLAPIYLTIRQYEMATTASGAPYRWMNGSISLQGTNAPARVPITEEAQVQSLPAATWANHKSEAGFSGANGDIQSVLPDHGWPFVNGCDFDTRSKTASKTFARASP
ncbi:hypothetical protein PBT88_00740 [Sphingomonas abietis]|uniref:Uncharacterized protein n=1 Tax=Sphingomonas abietis TaxID=3012344 RepID=A0ABY7NTD7_9SPHN|nr:hypothetical protein [Sphingomonas abietis]WBO22716.1 hypothetical protein PBT88_00740 [Sphingomonas abietis]